MMSIKSEGSKAMCLYFCKLSDGGEEEGEVGVGEGRKVRPVGLGASRPGGGGLGEMDWVRLGTEDGFPWTLLPASQRERLWCC